MKECLDEGTIQAHLDGEPQAKAAETTAAHLAACATCTELARVMQDEMALLSTALQPEFDLSVPSARMRSRIENAIADLQTDEPIAPAASAGSWFQSLEYLFGGSRLSALGYATVAVVVIAGVSLGIIYLRRGRVNSVSVTKKNSPVETIGPQFAPQPSGSQGPITPVVKDPGVVVATGPASRRIPLRRANRDQESAPGLFPGERDYIKTIAALDASIKSDNHPMRPGLQVEYEHNLAVLNQAIAATRVAAQRNPNDSDATQFMFSAYQSKVDLLTQVADARLLNTQRK
jgi:hypothetical protein